VQFKDVKTNRFVTVAVVMRRCTTGEGIRDETDRTWWSYLSLVARFHARAAREGALVETVRDAVVPLASKTGA
jgi:hypothetical protein